MKKILTPIAGVALLFCASCLSQIDDGAQLDGGSDSGQSDAGDGGSVDTCSSLDLSACRSRPDCAADRCFSCSCTPSFIGCRSLSAQAFSCPLTNCRSPVCCGSQGDCDASGPPISSCTPPGTPLGCGICLSDPGDCSVDTDCSTGNVCDPMQCSCVGAMACTPGCGMGAPCPIGSSCSQDAHPRCLATSCSPQTPCPANFDCSGAKCVRRDCVDDADCEAFCVLGQCFEGLGECQLPRP